MSTIFQKIFDFNFIYASVFFEKYAMSNVHKILKSPLILIILQIANTFFPY